MAAIRASHVSLLEKDDSARDPALTWLSCFAELRDFATQYHAGIVLIDANTLREQWPVIEWLQTWRPSWLPAVYLAPTHRAVRTTLLLLAERPLTVVLERKDGLRERLALLYQHRTSVEQSLRMVPLLASRLAVIDAILSVDLLAVYASYDGASSMKELVVRSGLSERHIRRLLRQAGVASGHLFFVASRILRAYEACKSNDLTATAIAQAYGFGSRRTLRRNWREVLGDAADECPMLLTDSVVRTIGSRILSARRNGGPPVDRERHLLMMETLGGNLVVDSSLGREA